MGLFALGGLLGKFTIYDVWREAESGATSISLSMKGVGISVFLLPRMKARAGIPAW